MVKIMFGEAILEKEKRKTCKIVGWVVAIERG